MATTMTAGLRAFTVTAELRALTERLQTEEPQEIRNLRTGSLAYQPGSYGQYFTTWDFAHGILRDYSMNLYQLLRMAAHEDLGVDNVLTILRTLDPIYSQYLGYSGFATLAEIAESITHRRSPIGVRSSTFWRPSPVTSIAWWLGRTTTSPGIWGTVIPTPYA